MEELCSGLRQTLRSRSQLLGWNPSLTACTKCPAASCVSLLSLGFSPTWRWTQRFVPRRMCANISLAGAQGRRRWRCACSRGDRRTGLRSRALSAAASAPEGGALGRRLGLRRWRLGARWPARPPPPLSHPLPPPRPHARMSRPRLRPGTRPSASLKSEAESLKGKLEEERAKLHDVGGAGRSGGCAGAGGGKEAGRAGPGAEAEGGPAPPG